MQTLCCGCRVMEFSMWKQSGIFKVPCQGEGQKEPRSGWGGILKNSNSFHFWNTYSVPDIVLRAFYAFFSTFTTTSQGGWCYLHGPGEGTEVGRGYTPCSWSQSLRMVRPGFKP